MNRINVLWALPLVLPFVFVAMVRLLWAMLGLPWEPDVPMAGFVVSCGVILSVVATTIVGFMQSEGDGVWWTIKKEKEKSDG